MSCVQANCLDLYMGGTYLEVNGKCNYCSLLVNAMLHDNFRQQIVLYLYFSRQTSGKARNRLMCLLVPVK